MEGEIATSDGGPPIRRIALATAADLRADYVMAAYDQHQRRLTSFAYALTRDADAADDLVQEAFLRLIKQRSEERRVGKECLTQCRSRWSPYH